MVLIIEEAGYFRGKMAKALKHKGRNKTPVGVYGDGGVIYLFYKTPEDKLFIEKSTDGHSFSLFKDEVKIFLSGVPFPLKHIEHINISRIFDNYFLSLKFKIKGNVGVYAAKGKDFDSFSIVSDIPDLKAEGVLVPNYQLDGKYMLLSGGEDIEAYFTKDLIEWEKEKTPIIKSHKDFFGDNPLSVGNAFLTDEGILFLYIVDKKKKNFSHFELRSVVLSKKTPNKILREIEHIIWESPDEWIRSDLKPLGIIKIGENFMSFYLKDKNVYWVSHPGFLFRKDSQYPQVILKKLRENPIIRPIIENIWESKATFNPAAVVEKDKVHIIYRAVGEDDVSVLGYAGSLDGLTIDERLPEPVYVPREPFESSGPYRGTRPPGGFASGGGCFGGCEDPRITKIDEKIYMTYVAYDGWNPPRVAITSIEINDFNNHNWNWEKPVLISKPGIVDKNACILPEKINGKYVIFHRVFPDILVDFVDSLNFDGKTFLKGELTIKPRDNFWDSRKIGVGPPPIKTDEGFLMIYQAVSEKDSGKYKVGAMLLDLKDPTQVIARSNEPVLSPEEWYENDGHKAGVVYPCGAVNLNGNLIIYYGGADTVVCVAQSNLSEFVHNLKRHNDIKLTPNLVERVN